LRTGRFGEYLGPKRDEVTEEWRKLHNGELHDLFSRYFRDGKMKEEKMGEACRGHEGDKCFQNFGWEDQKRKTSRKT
jgi:hypothetical protein